MADAFDLHDSATRWSLILDAQKTQGAEARNQLLVRYHGFIHKVLRTWLREPHAADALFSNFALRVLELDVFLRRANPEKGKFRNYLKAVLYRMVQDHHRQGQRQKARDEGLRQELAMEEGARLSPQEEGEFLDAWKKEIIAQVWRALERVEAEKGQPYATLFRLIATGEDGKPMRSHQLAGLLKERLGRSYTPEAVRQMVHRGREMHAELLLEEVERSLRDPPTRVVTLRELEEELIELGLLNSYCRKLLTRREG